MPRASSDELILAIDQGTTNSKAALISADGRVVSGGSAPVGISSPHADWVEQDADRLWSSVLEAMAGCIADTPDARSRAVALSTQRESVVGWQASTGTTIGSGDRLAGPPDDGLVQPSDRRPRPEVGARSERPAYRPDVLRSQDALALGPSAARSPNRRRTTRHSRLMADLAADRRRGASL